MKVFISLGYYDVREQELCSSSRILTYLVEKSIQYIEQCSGLSLGAVLYTQSLEGSFSDSIPMRRLRSGERIQEEVSAIEEILRETGDTDGRVMVFRPGQGEVFASRVQHFHDSLNLEQSPFAISTIKFSSCSHPMWNVMVSDRRFLSYGTIRQPRNGSRHVSRFDKLCPELWKTMNEAARAKGSQHLQDLFCFDQAMYAVNLDMLPKDTVELPTPQPIACPHDDGADDNWLLRLPIFKMSREQVLDISVLESFLNKEQPVERDRLVVEYVEHSRI